jgi:hypothetical protein
MKIKFNYAQGSVVATYKNDNATLQQAEEMLHDPSVISITVTKQTAAQYLKGQRALNVEAEGKE